MTVLYLYVLMVGTPPATTQEQPLKRNETNIDPSKPEQHDFYIDKQLNFNGIIEGIQQRTVKWLLSEETKRIPRNTHDDIFGPPHPLLTCYKFKNPSPITLLLEANNISDPTTESKSNEDEDPDLDLVVTRRRTPIPNKESGLLSINNGQVKKSTYVEADGMMCNKTYESFTSSMECYGLPGSIFERYCRFKNVCYKNNRILFFVDSARGRTGSYVFPRFSIYPGVGARPRNNVPLLSVLPVHVGNSEARIWLHLAKPCMVTKTSVIFSRTYNNFYFAMYSAFSLHATLRQFVPHMYPNSDYRDKILLFLVDRNHVREAASGLFEIFSSNGIGRLSHLDNYLEEGLCFEDVIVGLHKAAVLGEDLWYLPPSCSFPDRLQEMAQTDGRESNLWTRSTMLIANDTWSLPSALEDGSFRSTGRDWRNYLQTDMDSLPVFGISNNTSLRSTSYCNLDIMQNISREMLNDFSEFMLYKHGLLEIEPNTVLPDNGSSNSTVTITIVSRRKRRKLLNEVDLVKEIRKRWKGKVKVQSVKMEDFTFHEQMHIVRTSAILIGVHGAGFVHELWMSDTSSAIEIFPFKYYKPTYQVIAQLLNRDRVVWQNNNIQNTVFDWSRLGRNLTEQEREHLIQTTHLPGVSDAKLRNFFKNQDTIVDIGEMMKLLTEILDTKQENRRAVSKNQHRSHLVYS